MLNLITGMIVDVFFSRDIAKAGNKLANDPEYIKALKKLEDTEKKLVKLQSEYQEAANKELDYYFITFGIDLYSLDEEDQFLEMELIKRRSGKYKNLMPLSIQQQVLNRQTLQKQEEVSVKLEEEKKIAIIKAQLKLEQKRKTNFILIGIIIIIFGSYLYFKNYPIIGGIIIGSGIGLIWGIYKSVKKNLKSK